MISGYIGNQIKRATRNLLITNIVLALIVLAVPVIAAPYLIECLRGPHDMTVADIAKFNDKADAPHRFIRVPIDSDNLNDQLYHISGGNDNKDDYYHFLQTGPGQFLVIKSGIKELPTTVEGSIENLSDEVINNVLPGMGDSLQGSARPVMLDATPFRTSMYVILAICGPLLLLFLWNITKAVRRMGNPESHPLAKQLALVGPPEEMAIAIDAEVQAEAQKVGGVMVTRSWLIRPAAMGGTVLYLGDIAWAYKLETKHKTYGVTTSKTYSTVIFDVRGKQNSFPLNQAQVDSLLRELKARVPWAIVGFSADLQRQWRKNRKEVLAAVEQRKAQITAQASAAEGAPPPDGGAA